MSNDLVLSNDGYWHLTLFGHCSVIGQQIKMVRHSKGPWNSQAKRQTKNEGMDAKKNGKERLQPRLQAELRTLSAAGSVEPCS